MGLYLTPSKRLEPGVPSARDNLLDLYGLQELAGSVARVDPATGAKRKLRKSYKNHIADLPGKHVIPSREEAASLVGFARRPQMPSLAINPVSDDILAQIKFSRSPQAGIPGFDAKLFATSAVPEVNTDKKGRRDKDKEGNVEKKRRLQ